MVKVLTCVQALIVSDSLQISVTVPQLSLACTCAFTPSHVGSDAGFVPRSPPVGQVVIVGGVVSTKVICCTNDWLLPHTSFAVQVRLKSRRVHPPAGESL